jgi:hypothetical protein
MRVIISRTQNGAWMRVVEPGTIPELRHHDLSYQFDAYKHDGDDMSGLRVMLYRLMDEMGWAGDRHDRERIQIRVVHGDKFEHTDDDPAKDCRICAEDKQ